MCLNHRFTEIKVNGLQKEFLLHNFELEYGFCILVCFIVPMYTNMAWNPAEVDYFNKKQYNICKMYG